ncbi:adenylate/guanylate cyclase domain-containing protein [Leptospirillum ferrooxidans]|jgi:adenylate cyclase|nr:adenylate/guanylate cyclase domain-containing protein [Leptospirillum ferrooxidans]
MIKMPLFYKIFIFSLSIFLIAILEGDYLLENQIEGRIQVLLENETKMIALQMAKTIAAPLLLENRLQIENVLANPPAGSGISRLLILGMDKKIIADTREGVLNRKISDYLKSLRKGSTIRIIPDIDQGNDALLVTPILYAGIRIGTLLVIFSEDPVLAAQKDIRHSFLIISLFGAILSFFGALILSRMLSRPVRELHRATQAIGKGDLSVTVIPSSNDELGDLVLAFNGMITELKKSDALKNALTRYVSRDIAERVMEHPELIHVGGIRQKVVILFADIRGFSTLSENLPSEQVVTLLNEYYLPMFEIILSHSGYISNIMGDGIMVVFGIPEFLPSNPDSALKCAISLQSAIALESSKRVSEGSPVVEFGIGIHLGDCIVGNIGSGSRMEYTVVGQAVNIASRIESLSGPGEILISEDLKEALHGEIHCSPPQQVLLKGIESPVRILKVLEPG